MIFFIEIKKQQFFFESNCSATIIVCSCSALQFLAFRHRRPLHAAGFPLRLGLYLTLINNKGKVTLPTSLVDQPLQ
jgi:hypothetical protein